MQLPRGTFREIRKKAMIGGLISELERTRFTGTCSIFSGPATGTFVFRRGACILARFRGIAGDAGWDEMQKSAPEIFDVILSTLDDAQIKLSLEFNPACKIVKPGATPPDNRETTGMTTARKSSAAHRATLPRTPAGSPPRGAVIPSESSRPSAPLHVASSAPAAPTTPLQQGEYQKTAPDNDLPLPGPDSVENEFDALDSMDLEHVTSRIRSDCKTLIKELQLEHLMER